MIPLTAPHPSSNSPACVPSSRARSRSTLIGRPLRECRSSESRPPMKNPAPPNPVSQSADLRPARSLVSRALSPGPPSTTQTDASGARRPISTAANRPAGPAPTMTTSKGSGSATRCGDVCGEFTRYCLRAGAGESPIHPGAVRRSVDQSTPSSGVCTVSGAPEADAAGRKGVDHRIPAVALAGRG
jgi:hypothetical protein